MKIDLATVLYCCLVVTVLILLGFLVNSVILEPRTQISEYACTVNKSEIKGTGNVSLVLNRLEVTSGRDGDLSVILKTPDDFCLIRAKDSH